MTVNQKTLFDEGKLALERMCRDIRDASSITGSTATSITFVRAHETAPPDNVGDNAGETIIFRQNGTNLEKVKGANSYTLAGNVNSFTVTQDASNEIKLQLTLRLGTVENVTLQTKVYPKNLVDSATYKNYFSNWQEELS
jgi:hypothetical protein